MEKYNSLFNKEETQELEESYRYYFKELSKALPGDEYGINIKVRSASGESKWLRLTEEGVQAIRDFLLEVTPR